MDITENGTFGTKESPRKVIAERVVWANGSATRVNILADGQDFFRVSTKEGMEINDYHAVVVETEEGEHFLVMWAPDSVVAFSV